MQSSDRYCEMRTNLVDRDRGLLLMINYKPHPNCITYATAIKVFRLIYSFWKTSITAKVLYYTTQKLCIKFHHNPLGKVLKVLEQFIDLTVNVQQHN